MGLAFSQLPLVFRVLRTAWPLPKLGSTVVATRYDDVRQVFLEDGAFGVPYAGKLDVIMGGEPFFLGMGDTPQYRADTAAMSRVVRIDDLSARIAPEVTAAAEAVVAGAVGTGGPGRLEVVDGLVRKVTFDVLGRYFGVSDPPGGSLRVWGTRLFEFQFADPGIDSALRAEVDRMAPALRAHIDAIIARRRAAGSGPDDVLGRCVEMQVRGEPGFSDARIRTALMGFIVGGPPQPPMVVPQALEQLLRRPEALAGAQRAARADDDRLLAGHVFEAMRFDPLAPALPRVALKDWEIASGTPRARTIRRGETVLAAFSSAMMDERRIPDPRRFDPRRLPHEYIHFGYGLHTCFGIHINGALLPLVLKPLLKRPGLRRAAGSEGFLSKNGVFADRLVVEYG